METPERSSNTCTLDDAARVIQRWDSETSEDARDRSIFDGDRHEANKFLLAVDKIQLLLASISVGNDRDGESKEIEMKSHASIQIAMIRLEDEFRRIVLSHSTPTDYESLSGSLSGSLSSVSSINEEDGDSVEGAPVMKADSSSSSYRSVSSLREIDIIPAETVADLRAIAERMVTAGYARECVQVFVNARKPTVDSCLIKLGVERLSIGDVQRLELADLEGKIRRWIRAAKSAIRLVFAGEKRLCDTIFSFAEDARELGEACFMDTVKASAITLLNFAEAVSISRRAPEKLFKILDLYDALTELTPDINAVFASQSGDSIRIQSGDIVSHLAEAARGILSEFENMVLREPSKATVPGGTLHPLTRYVMNYISLISDYRPTLAELIVSKPNTSDVSAPTTELHVMETKTPLEWHLAWIIVILQSNLEWKSKHYKDASLEHLFMMNNIHYIVEKVKWSPELREMIGDDYLRKLTVKFRNMATSYQRATWARVLHCLRDEGIHVSGGFSSGVSKTVLRERFRSFNVIFEEVHRTQATWLIPDSRLREELRISMAETLIPAYRSFLGRFKSHLESTRHPENYMKYSVEDLETMLNDFFEGHSVRKRSL